MSIAKTLQLKKRIDAILKKLQEEALNKGINIASVEFEEILLRAKEKLLLERGITLEEYQQMMQELNAEKKKKTESKQGLNEKIFSHIEQIKGEKGDRGDRGDKGEDAVVNYDNIIKESVKRIPKPKDGKPGINGKDGKTIIRERIKELDKTQLEELSKDIRTLQLSYQDALKEISVSSQFMAGFDGEVSTKIKDLVSPEINRVVRSLQSQIFATNKRVEQALSMITSPVTIDLDSQCDGANQVFELGRRVNSILLVNNNGGLIRSTGFSLSAGGTQLTLNDYAPGAGEQLEAVCLV